MQPLHSAPSRTISTPSHRRFDPMSALAWLVIITGLSLACSLPALADGHENRTSLETLEAETAEALAAMKTYSVEQRDAAVAQIETTLNRLDDRIAELEDRLAREGAKLTAAAREEAREQLAALRQQRNELAEWFGGLKHGSDSAWDTVAEGFREAYRTITNSLTDAWKNL